MYHTVVGLRIEPELVEAMKIRALKEKRSLAAITQELWIEYLKTHVDDQTLRTRGRKRNHRKSSEGGHYV
jgi:hypothetical protein